MTLYLMEIIIPITSVVDNRAKFQWWPRQKTSVWRQRRWLSKRTTQSMPYRIGECPIHRSWCPRIEPWTTRGRDTAKSVVTPTPTMFVAMHCSTSSIAPFGYVLIIITCKLNFFLDVGITFLLRGRLLKEQKLSWFPHLIKHLNQYCRVYITYNLDCPLFWINFHRSHS